VNEDVMCDIHNSIAYDVIEVKLCKSLDPSHWVTLHLKYNDLQRCLPSHVTLSCGRFFHIYTVSQKCATLSLAIIFAKYQPIFGILSLAQSVYNLQ